MLPDRRQGKPHRAGWHRSRTAGCERSGAVVQVRSGRRQIGGRLQVRLQNPRGDHPHPGRVRTDGHRPAMSENYLSPPPQYSKNTGRWFTGFCTTLLLCLVALARVGAQDKPTSAATVQGRIIPVSQLERELALVVKDRKL